MADVSAPCLESLSSLERRFDGPIPAPLREAALLGGSLFAALLLAEAQVCFFASLMRGQIATIRRRRKDGTLYPALVLDLWFYRERLRMWREELIRLRNLQTTTVNCGKGRECFREFPISVSVISPATLSSHDTSP